MITGKKLNPEMVVAISAAVWGLFWIPLRAFEGSGLEAEWITLSQFLAPLVVLSPFVVLRLLKHQPTGIEQYKTGLLIGAAFVFYCESLLLTDVVRALVLFYVMPAWGTLIEVCFMGRRFTMFRGLALLLSLSGLLTILGLGSDIDFSMNSGDILALLSGIVFTIGATRVRQSEGISVFEQIFAFFFFGSIISVIIILLPFTSTGSIPTAQLLWDFMPWFTLMSVGFLIPIMWGLYWGSQHVDPGRLGILLQLEAVVGITSAALWAGEVFGWREALGAVLVISAGLVEVMGNKNSSK
jgi:drug/metabolite transporter (DMT)-like permease